MDNKILSALNDLTLALDAVAESLKDKSAKSEAGKILQSINNIDKKIESISNGLKSIKKDTTQILKNQETLLRISKDKKETKLFEVSGEKKSKIKDGVSTVLLIAAGVLAIGVAFKLIGSVNFLSVIALSIALPLVAMAFEKIAEMKHLKRTEMVNLFFVTVTIASSITAASWIMSLIVPISFTQGLTAILIAGTFAVISYGIEKITKGIKDVKASDLVKMPLVLFSVGLSIALASQVMRFINPISISQGLTAILIAGTFAVIGYGIKNLVNGIKGITPEDALLLPLILIPFSIAMVGASFILQGIQPLTFKQFIGTIGIAIALTAMTLPLLVLSYAVKNTNIKDVALMVAILPLMSLGIVLSSKILAKTEEIDGGLLWNVVLQSITIGIMGVALGAAMFALKEFKLGVKEVTLGAISIVIIAGALAAASQLIALGNYANAPTIEWALGAGLSLVAFGAGVMAIGSLIVAEGIGLGLAAVGLGAVGMLVVAGTLVASSKILSAGEYGNYPSFDWALGVSLSMGAFAVGVAGLGTMILGTLGAGLLVLEIGAKGVDIISNAIVSSAAILSTGEYKGGPTKDWAEGVALSLGAFAPIFKVLFDRGIIGLFSKGPSADDFSNAITKVSQGIVTAAEFFKGKTGIWAGGPTADWAAGVGGAIGAFAPVFDALSKSSGLFGSGPTPDDMINAMISISAAIVAVGQFFVNQPSNIWTGGPKSTWSESISTALQAFAPIFDYLNQNTHWYSGADTDKLKSAVTSIAEGIVAAANSLNDAKFNTTIPDGYMRSLTDNVKLYVELVEYLENKNVSLYGIESIFGITTGLAKLAEGYERLSKGVKSLGNALSSIDMEKIDALNRVSGNVILMSLMDSNQFESMMDALEAKAGIFVKVVEELQTEAEKAAKNTNYPVRNIGGAGGGSSTAAMEQKLDQIVANTTNLAASIGAAVANSIKSPFDHLISELKNAMAEKGRKGQGPK